jgi:hypothetical protein
MFINLGIPRLLAALRGKGKKHQTWNKRDVEKQKDVRRESKMAVTALRDLRQSINWSPPAIGVKILAIEFRWKSQPGFALSHFAQSSSRQ